MRDFHGTVNRRTFMKGLGFMSAGLGASAALGTTFHDLDEVQASGNANTRPWWVKRKDEPTVEIDWSMVTERFECIYNCHNDAGYGRYFGYDKLVSGKAAASAWSNTQVQNNEPGFRLRDTAVASGASTRNTYFSQFLPNPSMMTRAGTVSMGASPFDGPKMAKTPTQQGIPNYTGTPEENSNMIRAALKLYGAVDVGITQVTSNEKKFFCHSSGRPSIDYLKKWPPPTTITRPIEMKDVPAGYMDMTTGYFYVPSNVQLYGVTYTIPMSIETRRTAPSNLDGAGCENTRYPQGCTSMLAIQDFIWGLGYNSINDAPYPLAPSGIGAILSGLTEQSRQQSYVIYPEHGPNVGLFDFYTDLPLAPTKPIDAGVWRFCQSCKKCAETCPGNAISMKNEPTYDPDKSAITPAMDPLPDISSQNIKNPGAPEYHRRGAKVFWTDFPACNGWRSLTQKCSQCFGACSFNVDNAAMIHQLVHSVSSTTGLFNGFFASLSSSFGYGVVQGEDKEKWWDMNLPSYGADHSMGAREGLSWRW